MHSSKGSRSAFRSAFGSPFGSPFRSPRATQKGHKRHNRNGMRVNENYKGVQSRYRSKGNELSEKNLFEPPLKELIETINENLNQLRTLAPKAAKNINAIERELNEIKQIVGLEYEIFENF